jgi:hypothetical protein
MIRRSRKSDQPPPTDKLPSRDVEPAPASEPACEKCGAASDSLARGAEPVLVRRKDADAALGLSRRDRIRDRREALSHAARSPSANKQASITNTARGTAHQEEKSR